MTKQDKMKAIEMLSETLCTVEMKAVIDGHVYDDKIAITDCCHNSIKILMENGYFVSMNKGKMIVDKH